MVSPTRVYGCDSLLLQLSEARARSDALFDIVRPEAFYERPIAERHRIIFYLGHLEAFDWNLFGRELGGLKSFAPSFDKLFAFGIDPVNRTTGRSANKFFTITKVYGRRSMTNCPRCWKGLTSANGRFRNSFMWLSSIGSCTLRHSRTCCTVCLSPSNSLSDATLRLARRRSGLR